MRMRAETTVVSANGVQIAASGIGRFAATCRWGAELPCIFPRAACSSNVHGSNIVAYTPGASKIRGSCTCCAMHVWMDAYMACGMHIRVLRYTHPTHHVHMPCHALPCPTMPYHALPCPALPCPAMPRTWQRGIVWHNNAHMAQHVIRCSVIPLFTGDKILHHDSNDRYLHNSRLPSTQTNKACACRSAFVFS